MLFRSVSAIIKERPDIVLTIDSPGFAKAVISKVRKSEQGRNLIDGGMRFHHVVAPQVWAWRAGRAKKYARLFDKLYAFFDFELPYFTKYGLSTMAVGHPIAEGLVGKKVKETSEKIITLIPGSRMSEVKRLMPLYRDVVSALERLGHVKYKYVIPTVETTRNYIKESVRDWPIEVKLLDSAKRYDVYAKTYIAIAASGTVSAELAMLHIPTIVVYKMNPITIWLARRVVNIRWVSLVNILLGRGVYPELLGGDATCENIMTELTKLNTLTARARMIKDLSLADGLWCRSNGLPAHIIAKDLRSYAKA